MNGFIQSKIVKDSGLDGHGEPYSGSESWSEKKDCKFRTNMNRSNGRYTDGEFVQSEYEITVFDMNFSGSEVRLFNSRNQFVCQKPVLSLQELDTIQRVKIII